MSSTWVSSSVSGVAPNQVGSESSGLVGRRLFGGAILIDQSGMITSLAMA